MVLRVFGSLVLLIGLSPVKSQVWCPPGATWTYGTDFISMYGYQQYSYVGDTLLAGLQAHRLSGQGAMSYYGQSQVDYWSNPLSFITAMDGDVALVWVEAEQDWDTLFWFGAVPGDAWPRSPGLYGPCAPIDSLVIIDTTTVILDGVALRQWQVEQRMNGASSGNTVFTERLGWYWNFVPYPACMIVDGPSGMRCYSDQDISVQLGLYGCTSLVGISEHSEYASYQPFPNPGTDHFTLELPPGAHVIEVFDAIGQCMLVERSTTGMTTVSTGSLANGIYLVLVDGMRTARWLKQ